MSISTIVIDPKTYLNNQLLDKPKIKILKTIITTETECRTEPEIPWEGRLYQGYDEIKYMPTRLIEVCKAIKVEKKVEEFATPYVENAEIIEVKNFKFLEEKIQSLPEKVRYERQVISNRTNATYSRNIVLTRTITKGHSISKTKLVSSQNSKSINTSITIPKVGTLGGSMSWSGTISLTDMQAENHSETITRTTTDNIQVPSNTSIAVETLVYENTIEIPFEAEITINGQIQKNISNINYASDILSLEDRTITVSGSLTITDASEINVKITPLGENLSINEGFFIISDIYSYEYNVNDFIMNSNFQSLKDFLQSEKISISSSIENPDGISYRIIGTQQIYKPSLQCGFNDLGAINIGVFEVENRIYYHYVEGKLLSQWTEDSEKFISCWNP